MAGRGRSIKTFLYVFVDTFIGGGLVIDSHLHSGLNGNAGAVGSMPMSLAGARQSGPPAQLLSVASLFNLEALYREAGVDASASTRPEALTGFDSEGYAYAASLSTPERLVFRRALAD